eukprot:gene53167-72615_t
MTRTGWVRLMRLRSAVVQSFGSFDAHMVRMVALLGEFGAVQTPRPCHRGGSLGVVFLPSLFDQFGTGGAQVQTCGITGASARRDS